MALTKHCPSAGRMYALCDPQWCTKSVSKLPVAFVAQESRSIGTSLAAGGRVAAACAGAAVACPAGTAAPSPAAPGSAARRTRSPGSRHAAALPSGRQAHQALAVQPRHCFHLREQRTPFGPDSPAVARSHQLQAKGSVVRSPSCCRPPASSTSNISS